MNRTPIVHLTLSAIALAVLGASISLVACSSDSSAPANAGGASGSAQGGSGGAGGSGIGGSGKGGTPSGGGGGGVTTTPAWECTGTELDCTCFYSEFPDTTKINKACGLPASKCCDHPKNGAPSLCVCEEAFQWMCSKDSTGFCMCELALAADYRKSYGSRVIPAEECGPPAYDVCCNDKTQGCTCFNAAVWGSSSCSSASDQVVPSCATKTLVPDPRPCDGQIVPYCTPGAVGGSGGSGGSGGAGGAGGSSGNGGAGGGVTTEPQTCSVALHDGACGNCERGLCCSELEACFADATCRACWSSSPPGNCASNAAFSALAGCDLGNDCGDACLTAPTAQIKQDSSPVGCTHDVDCYGCTRCSGDQCRLCLVGPLGCTCQR